MADDPKRSKIGLQHTCTRSFKEGADYESHNTRLIWPYFVPQYPARWEKTAKTRILENSIRLFGLLYHHKTLIT